MGIPPRILPSNMSFCPAMPVECISFFGPDRSVFVTGHGCRHLPAIYKDTYLFWDFPENEAIVREKRYLYTKSGACGGAFCSRTMRNHLSVIFLFVLLALPCAAAQGDFPAWYVTTTSLNVRAADHTGARILTTLPPYTEIRVEYMTSNHWGAIRLGQQRGYVSGKYIRYLKPVEQTPPPTPVKSTVSKNKKKNNWWHWVLIGGLWFLLIAIVRDIGVFILSMVGMFMYRAYWILCIPFYILNWLQRHLAKPWRQFYRTNSGWDWKNAELRKTYEWAKLPLYILLTPLRLLNAAYYNLLVHCCFEMYNYVIEVFLPSNRSEGRGNVLGFVFLAPWRVLRYVVWHGGLTILESAVWTVVDTFVPALTLFHGTDEEASTTITNAGRDGNSHWLTGVWNVGGGNFAGNGIYFAPARSTALHYASGSLIVCRVSLGKVLDLGLAPSHVYRQCGHSNALEATRWGLQNGYVTGEWWRGDNRWWEYCMYDWQNRYNHSWRIRPLYVLNLNKKIMQRIPGGMCHWLFRKMVVQDLITYFNEKWR